jgi:hypothetical protein
MQGPQGRTSRGIVHDKAQLFRLTQFVRCAG